MVPVIPLEVHVKHNLPLNNHSSKLLNQFNPRVSLPTQIASMLEQTVVPIVFKALLSSMVIVSLYRSSVKLPTKQATVLAVCRVIT
jgi:ABC-type bacteriocin/lantibiotic exporter with double-glycine peptidase domain